MAKVLLRGAALLLGSLALVRSDLECKADIKRIDLADSGQIQLNCIVTGNATSLTWTRDGQRIPVTPEQPANLIVEVPSEYAKGYADFECHVQCSEDLSQRVTMTLGSGKLTTGVIATMAVSLSLAAVFIGIAVRHIGCHHYRSYQRRRAEQENAADLGLGGLALAMSTRPLTARPLTARPLTAHTLTAPAHPLTAHPLTARPLRPIQVV